MSQSGFEPTIPASERLQTHVLDRTATNRCKQVLGLFITYSTLLYAFFWVIPPRLNLK